MGRLCRSHRPAANRDVEERARALQHERVRALPRPHCIHVLRPEQLPQQSNVVLGSSLHQPPSSTRFRFILQRQLQPPSQLPGRAEKPERVAPTLTARSEATLQRAAAPHDATSADTPHPSRAPPATLARSATELKSVERPKLRSPQFAPGPATTSRSRNSRSQSGMASRRS